MNRNTLQSLGETLTARAHADPQTSYSAALIQGGSEGILKKVGEEATEVVIAGCAADDAAVVREVADLWFHTLVLLAARGLGPEDVLDELDRRSGVSGHEEKAARSDRID